MAKGNPFLIKRAEAEKSSRVLVSRSVEGLEFPWNVKRLGQIEMLSALDLGQQLAARFVDGNETLPPVDGQAVLASRAACFLVGTLLTAQTGEPDGRYNEFEVFAMLTDDAPGWEMKNGKQVRLPSLFDQLGALSDECSPGEEAPPFDPLAQQGSPSSSSPPSPS